MEFLFIFLEGIASFISPCVLPLVPIYISYFAGKEDRRYKTLKNALAFVLGFSIVFVLLAIFANRFGTLVVGLSRYIKIIFGVIIIILGLNYMNIIKLNIFNKFKKYQMDVNNLNFIKSLIFGMMFSISMTPCVGTFLTSALLLIASETELFKGIILIIFYCLGLGIPFVLSAFFIEKMKKGFVFIKKNYSIVEFVCGTILIFMGLYLIIK